MTLGPMLGQDLYQVGSCLICHILFDRRQLDIEHVMMHLLTLRAYSDLCWRILLSDQPIGHLLGYFVKLALDNNTTSATAQIMQVEIHLCSILRCDLLRKHRFDLVLLHEVNSEFNARSGLGFRL